MAPPPDAPLQRLRRAGAVALPGAGPAEELLSARLPPGAERVLRRLLKPAIWLGAAAPLALTAVQGATGGLGANPIETVTHRTGYAALVLLLLSLAVTPARTVSGWNGVVQGRRLLGLWAFAYATLHLLVFAFDQGFDLAFVAAEVAERPYVTAGFAAWLVLVPLAATSTRAAIRRLGKRWQTLHRMVYIAAVLAVVHFLWLVKADLREPLIFAAVLAGLLAFRLPLLRRRRSARGGAPPAGAPAGR